MNFDKLQEQWKSEPQNIPEIPKELDKIKEVHNPIDKVRSNMKKELIVQSVLIIAVAFFPFLNIGKWDSQHNNVCYFLRTYGGVYAVLRTEILPFL